MGSVDSWRGCRRGYLVDEVYFVTVWADRGAAGLKPELPAAAPGRQAGAPIGYD